MNEQEMIVIGLGSNLGDRLRQLQKALGLLENILTGMRCSAIVESAAHLLPGSPLEWDLPYLNCAVTGFTTLTPYELLGELKKIEQRMGAERMARWAPRIIDLDILAYGDRVIQEEALVIPHKELLNRPFALFPMGQLLPYWKYPVEGTSVFGKTVLELMHASSLHVEGTLLAKPQLVGILNLTPDSFSDGGLFMEKEKAVNRARYLWESGASFIDLGAASTKPGAKIISQEEEWHRLHPVLSALQQLPIPFRISIDTYHQITAMRAIDLFDVAMINFIGNQIGKELAERIEEKEKLLVCMHSLTLPPDRLHVLSPEQDPIEALLVWAEQTRENLEQWGVSKKRLILDPGIGFGKTAAQNLIILKRVNELKKMEIPLLVGHSRKSFMHSFASPKDLDRDWQSAAISLHLMHAGVDYLRVHDVHKHRELLVADQSLSIGESHVFAPV